ncbi:MAG: hypothetical protein E7520_03790 [Ruminococcaceae bacterium]|nr:hypothetical protein [Oscillospiraceae bacterium]
MDTIESLGYLKGLIDGLDLDENKKETKVFKAILDVLENLSEDVDCVYDDIEDICDELDAVSEDLSDLEDCVYDDDDDDWDDFDEEYEIECPNCGEIISVDEETVMEGGIECPNCGETLEFEVEFEDEFEEDEE